MADSPPPFLQPSFLGAFFFWRRLPTSLPSPFSSTSFPLRQEEGGREEREGEGVEIGGGEGGGGGGGATQIEG